jgi:hypothetical protein
MGDARSDVPIWVPPFEPRLERVMTWLRKRATPGVQRAIASADWEYDAEVRKELNELLAEGEVHWPLASNLLECCELVSNHWYGNSTADGASEARHVLMLGGVVAVLVGCLRDSGSTMASEGRLGRVVWCFLSGDSETRLCGLHFAGSCATRDQPRAQELFTLIPHSFYAFSVLCLSAALVVDRGKPKAGDEWISREHCETLADEVVAVVERDMARYADDWFGDGRMPWLVGLDTEQRQFGEWWLLAKRVKDILPATMPRTLACIERVLAECDRPEAYRS